MYAFPRPTAARMIGGSLLATCLALASCEPNECERTWTQTMTVPVTLDRVLVHDSIAAEPPRQLCVGGGIYAYEQYVFVNSPGEGYHLLDNSDPANPANVAFLQVPGATQMAFVDGEMVSDSYADLVVLDFGGPQSLSLTSWTPNFLLDDGAFEVFDGLVVTGYEEQEVTFTEDCSGDLSAVYFPCGDRLSSSFINCAPMPMDNRVGSFAFSDASAESFASVNVAGSLSRFAFAGPHLYVLGRDRLDSYRLESDSLRPTDTDFIGWDLETVVAREGFLYVGAQSGMHILDLADPEQPEYTGNYNHFTACDPVAVEGDVALVTLRSGRDCGNAAQNVLVALDITDRTRPVRHAQIELTNPTGVALHDGIAYVCDGPAGLRVFDVAGGSLSALDEREVEVVGGREMRDVAVLPYAQQISVLTTGPDHVTQLSPSEGGGLRETSSLGANNCARS